jgi:hypothetical protein
MESALVIHGIFANQTFVPDKPVPEVRGRADLIVYPESAAGPASLSVFELCGKAAVLRSGEDIDAQIEEERRAWDDR